MPRSDKRVFVALLCALAAAACRKASNAAVSEQAQEQQQELSAAHAFFDTSVYPELGSCIQCHTASSAGAFLDPTSADTSYTIISTNFIGMIEDPTKSPLVQYQHTDPNVVVTTEQKSVLIQWLRREVDARGLPGAIPLPKTAADAYAQLAQCSTFALWNNYNVGDLARVSTSTDEGLCMGCHEYGQGGFYAHPDTQNMFEHSLTFPYVQKYLQVEFDANGTFKDFVLADRLYQKSMEVCPTPETPALCHPNFVLPDNVRQNVNAFFQQAATDVVNGLCGAFQLVVTADAGADGGTDGGM